MMSDLNNLCCSCCNKTSEQEIEFLIRQLKREVEELMKSTEARLLMQDNKIAETCLYLKNNLTVKGITDARDFVTKAINILANKAITFDAFACNYYPEMQLPEILKKYTVLLKNGAPLPEQLDVVKFVF